MRSACLVRTHFILNIFSGISLGAPGPPLATPLIDLCFLSVAYLAHPAQQARWSICYAAEHIVKTMSDQLPGISKCTSSIIMKFAGLVDLWLCMIDMKLVFYPSRDVAMATNFRWPYPQNCSSEIR